MGKSKNPKQAICPVCGMNMARSDYDPGDGFAYMYCINTEYVDHNGYTDFCPEWGISKRFVSPKSKAYRHAESGKFGSKHVEITVLAE